MHIHTHIHRSTAIYTSLLTLGSVLLEKNYKHRLLSGHSIFTKNIIGKTCKAVKNGLQVGYDCQEGGKTMLNAKNKCD